MTARHLQIFVEIYRTGSITKAAQNLFLTQPAVTRALHETEAHYGVQLFERMNRRLRVTESGRRFYAQAVHILEAMDLLEKQMHNWDTQGVLRVGATITLGNFLMPEAAARFRSSRPQVRVQVTVSNSRSLQQALLDNRLDFALIEGTVEDTNLHAEVFGGDRMVPVLPPDHPLLKKEHVVLEDLAGCDLLLREPGSAGRTYLDSLFAVRGIVPHPLWESVSTQAIVQAVHRGLGVSLLPEQLVRAWIDAGFVATCALENAPLDRRHSIVWHKNKNLTPSALELIRLCRAAVHENNEGEK